MMKEILLFENTYLFEHHISKLHLKLQPTLKCQINLPAHLLGQKCIYNILQVKIQSTAFIRHPSLLFSQSEMSNHHSYLACFSTTFIWQSRVQYYEF